MNARGLLAALLLFAWTAVPALGQSEVHGSSDVYAAPDVALAWGVLRGASDADTMIVIRVVANANAYGSVAVFGINPFSKAEQPLQPPIAPDHGVDVQIPRARFAELPRTEFRFYAARDKAQSGSPKLTVFYLGVPDTTPEFADRTKLDAYLAERIARARNEKGPR
jgi:hypothetical protein